MVANKTNYGWLLIQSVVGALSTIFLRPSFATSMHAPPRTRLPSGRWSGSNNCWLCHTTTTGWHNTTTVLLIAALYLFFINIKKINKKNNNNRGGDDDEKRTEKRKKLYYFLWSLDRRFMHPRHYKMVCLTRLRSVCIIGLSVCLVGKKKAENLLTSSWPLCLLYILLAQSDR